MAGLGIPARSGVIRCGLVCPGQSPFSGALAGPGVRVRAGPLGGARVLSDDEVVTYGGGGHRVSSSALTWIGAAEDAHGERSTRLGREQPASLMASLGHSVQLCPSGEPCHTRCSPLGATVRPNAWRGG